MEAEGHITPDLFDSGGTTPRPLSSMLRLNRARSLDSLYAKRQLAADSSADGVDRSNSPDSDFTKNELEDLEKGSAAPSSPTIPVTLLKGASVVDWDGPSDPDNPFNFSARKKWYMTVMLSLVTFCVTLASSIFCEGTIVTAKQYNVSTEVTTLATSLFVLGFALGPLVWGPLSELYGRMIPIFVGFGVFTVFQIPVATAQNLHTVLISRFIAGAFGSAPLATCGGVFFDMWDPITRGIAVTVFIGGLLMGPFTGPIVGGFIVDSHLGWRWTAWLVLILSVCVGLVAVSTIPETYAPVILQRRAARRRHETGNWALHSAMDERRPAIAEIATNYLSRPIMMLICEPILLLLTIYLSLVYGIMYIFFFAYPIEFLRVRGWKNLGLGALPFLGLLIGVIVGVIFIVGLIKIVLVKKLKERGRLAPEERLPPMILAAITLPIGLFWFAWTSNKDICWFVQVTAGVPIGFSVIIIFLGSINYIVDVYLTFSNSAIAANTFVRSLFGAAFPLFANQMFTNLGVDWATTVLAFLTLLMVPVPVLFYIYGAKIRAMSKFIPKK